MFKILEKNLIEMERILRGNYLWIFGLFTSMDHSNGVSETGSHREYEYESELIDDSVQNISKTLFLQLWYTIYLLSRARAQAVQFFSIVLR